MHPQTELAFNPRKLPTQTRSAITVSAILEATIQVLLREGKEKLTTTLVARRAGVSVGTLYQYFPNKTAVLQEVLRRHLGEVADAVEQACRDQRGAHPEAMGRALVRAFLGAKLRDVKTSVALYAVGSDVEGMKIARQVGTRSRKAIEAMLESASEPMDGDVSSVAAALQGALAGVGRSLVESPGVVKPGVQVELEQMVCSYLRGKCRR